MNKESYEWVVNPDLPTKNLVKITAKTTAPTFHPDSKYPVRIFKAGELEQAARSLREIGVNHQSLIDGAIIIDAQWNPITQAVEAIGFLPTSWIEKVREGKIQKVSVEYTWRAINQTEQGAEFEGIIMPRVDLLEGLDAGDPNTSITLFESNTGRFEGEIGLTESAPAKEPEKPKVDPEIKKVDDLSKKNLELLTQVEKKVVDLEKALSTAIAEHEKAKKEFNSKLAEARKEAKKEVVEKVKKTVPNEMIKSRFNGGAQRFVEEVKKALRESE